MVDRKESPSATARVLEARYQGRTFYYPEHSMSGECTAEGQGWDRVLIPILQSLFPQETSPRVVEVGTNIGSSLLQMEIAKPEAQFYCFEPVNRFHDIAKKNIETNDWNNVTLEHFFMSDKMEDVELGTNATTASAVVKRYAEPIPQLEFIDTQSAKSSTLDQYFGERDVDFIKSDTDGYEYHVLKGAESLLRRSKPFLYFEFEPKVLEQGETNPEELLKYLQGLGYDKFLVLSNFGEAISVETDIQEVIRIARETEYYVDLLAVNAKREIPDNLVALKNKIGNNYAMYPSNAQRAE